MYEPLAKVQSQAASESDNEHEGDTLFEDNNFMPDDTVLQCAGGQFQETASSADQIEWYV